MKPLDTNGFKRKEDPAMPPLSPARPVVVILSLVFVGCAQQSPDECIVPDVVGLSLSAAASAIMDIGLTVDTPSLQHSDTVPVDHVIDQTPGAGAVAPRTMPISLVISLGPSVSTQDEPSLTETETNTVAVDSSFDEPTGK